MINFAAMKSIALFSHVRPDGDTFGCMFGMKYALEECGKKVNCFCDSPMPDDLSYLDPDHTLNQQTLTDYDACIALDSADASRLGSYQSLFFSIQNTYNIDHHHTNPLYAKTNIVRDSACACEIVYDLLLEAAIPLSQKTAMCLYTGLVTDTGSFSQANTTAHTHAVASKLVEQGIDVEWLHNRLMKVISKGKLALIAERIQALRFFCEDKVSVMTLTYNDLSSHGLTLSDTEGFISYALNIEGVVMALCITQSEKEQFKVSFRCRKGFRVDTIAATFGGGGHFQAAGCAFKGILLEEIIEKLVRECESGLYNGRNH